MTHPLKLASAASAAVTVLGLLAGCGGAPTTTGQEVSPPSVSATTERIAPTEPPSVAFPTEGGVPQSITEPPSVTPPLGGDATHDPVEAFLDFASGGTAQVSWADETAVYFNGVEARRLNPQQAALRASWTTCPRTITAYEGRECPVSVLTVIRDANRGKRSTSTEDRTPAVVGCNRVRDPTAVVGKLAGWIRPNQDRDCFGDFAVGVYADDTGAISAINFVLSGP
jgi:hypothetical protein